MKIVRTTHYEPLQLMDEQVKNISSTERINDALKNDDCLGFYLCQNERISSEIGKTSLKFSLPSPILKKAQSIKIGFALLRKFKTN